MLTAADSGASGELSWEQRLLRHGGRPRGALKPEYQQLKFTLHRKLLDKINLEALATIENQRVRSEVRQALTTLIEGEPTLLSSIEKQQKQMRSVVMRELGPVLKSEVLRGEGVLSGA